VRERKRKERRGRKGTERKGKNLLRWERKAKQKKGRKAAKGERTEEASFV